MYIQLMNFLYTNKSVLISLSGCFFSCANLTSARKEVILFLTFSLVILKVNRILTSVTSTNENLNPLKHTNITRGGRMTDGMNEWKNFVT